MFLILITSQIVNLKTIENVLELRKCYQCGGETLDPVVKHSVSDSTVVYLYIIGVKKDDGLDCYCLQPMT